MSSSATHSSFARLAASYDRLRPLDDRWLETVGRMVELGDLRGRRVLDVGCGTGRLAIALAHGFAAKVWGIDASPEMLAVAREKEPGIGWKIACAESLPFRDGWFERAVTSLVIHHLDRPRAFGEVRRVLQDDGRFVISTPNPEGLEGHWLAPLFPSFVGNERARFPDADAIVTELRDAGFGETVVERLEIPRGFNRAFGLERLRGRYGSMFDLLGDDEYEQGLARAERELPDPVRYVDLWLLVAAKVAA
jgi:SAM-dependent methyltransferase